jgi:hypothetical protein
MGVVPVADMPAGPPLSSAGVPVRGRAGREQDSSPLIPARDGAAEKLSAEVELRRKREALVARRRGRFLAAGVFLALVFALMGAAVGYGTRPTPADDPQAAQQREAAQGNYERDLLAEDQRHQQAVSGVQEQLDRARKNIGSQEIQNLIKKLEGEIAAENGRHQRALEALESGRTQAVSNAQQEDPWAGASRAGVGAALAFFVTLALAFVGSRVVIKDQ